MEQRRRRFSEVSLIIVLAFSGLVALTALVCQENWLNDWLSQISQDVKWGNYSFWLKLFKKIETVQRAWTVPFCFGFSLPTSPSIPPGFLVSWHGNKEAQLTTWATCSRSWTQTSRLPPSLASWPRWWSGETFPSPRKPSSVTGQGGNRTPWRP